jgi:hypothetical protein
MNELTFIETAAHNRPLLNKIMRNMLVIATVCAIAAIVALQFYESHTEVYTRYRWGQKDETREGWPVLLFGWGCFLAGTFLLFYLNIRFKQDLRKPSFGVTKDGIFINQVALRNAFVPWHNIETVKLAGPAESPFMRITFKDYTALVKGQPFPLKSMSKQYFKAIPILSISKGTTVGDIKKMYDLIAQKLMSSQNETY